MTGGGATFFTSRRVGQLADRYGKKRVFRIAALLSVRPVLFITHLPDVPFYVMVLFFPVFMVTMSSRMVPMQALLTTGTAPQTRGAWFGGTCGGGGGGRGGVMPPRPPTPATNPRSSRATSAP